MAEIHQKSDGKSQNDQPAEAPTQNEVLLKLLLHSIAMFSFPFITYYMTKKYLEEAYDIPDTKSYIYGLIAAVVVVHIIIVSYIIQAFKEESRFKKAEELKDKVK